ncbi:MAG: hypothetical protein IKZ02_02435, partial [Alphaproteobacteria bacterium]|nr:hypothetical protein [Alphaproteobacteria bacterium]
LESIIHKTIKKVQNDLNTMAYNTSISALMILANNYDAEEAAYQRRRDAGRGTSAVLAVLHRNQSQVHDAEQKRAEDERMLAELREIGASAMEVVQVLDGIQEAREKVEVAESAYNDSVAARENAEQMYNNSVVARQNAEAEVSAQIAVFNNMPEGISEEEALCRVEDEIKEADRLATEAENVARNTEYKQSVEALFAQNDYLKDKVPQNYLIDDAFFNHAIEKGFTPEQICFLLEAHYRINDDSFKTEHIQKMQSLGLSGNTLFYYGVNEHSLLEEATNALLGPDRVEEVRLLLDSGARVENADILAWAIPSSGFPPKRKEILTMLIQHAPAEFLQDENVFLRALGADLQVFEFLQQKGMLIPENAEAIITNSRNGQEYKQELLNRLSARLSGKQTTTATLSANTEQKPSQSGLMTTLQQAETQSAVEGTEEEFLLGRSSQNVNC